MNWLDVLIIVVIIWFAFTGLNNGLLREVVTLVASMLGVVIAGRLYPRLADDIKIVHDDPRVDQLIAFVAIFTAVVLAGQILSMLLRGVASTLRLGSLDSAGGLVFGLLKGCVIVELLLIAFATFPPTSGMNTALHTSLLAPVFLHGVPVLLRLLPGSFRQGVRAF